MIPSVESYVSFLNRGGKYGVMAAWLVVLLVGAVFAPRFPDSTSVAFQAPASYPAHAATSAMNAAFGTLPLINVVMVESKDGSSVDVPEVRGREIGAAAAAPHCRIVAKSRAAWRTRRGGGSCVRRWL
jgi:hypothetical protein